MNAKVEIVEGKLDHLKSLDGRLRLADITEIYSATGENPYAVIRNSWDASVLSWAILYKGRTVCVYGVAPVFSFLGAIGTPWMVGTDEMAAPSVKWVLTKTIKRKYIPILLDRFPCLLNFIDVRNTSSIKWLKWCGFKFDKPVKYGYSQLPFFPFYMEKRNV